MNPSSSTAKNTYGYEWSKLFADAYEECRNWEALAGDSLFTRSGSRYTANIDLQDMLGSDPDTSTSTIKYTLDTSNGSISGSTSSSYTNWYTQSITTIEFSGKLRSLSFTRTEQVKNKSKLVRRSTLTASPTDTAKSFCGIRKAPIMMRTVTKSPICLIFFRHSYKHKKSRCQASALFCTFSGT